MTRAAAGGYARGMVRVLAGLSSLALGLLLACGPGSAGGDCGDTPPSAGDACEAEGQVCGGDGCAAPAFACKGGAWQPQTADCDSEGSGAPTTGGASTATDATATDATATAATTGGDAVPCGDRLPPDGSPCATQGEDCAPDADPCSPYEGALCQRGTWHHYEVGGGDPSQCGDPIPCDPQDLPPEGSKCAMEGESCSPGCADPCSFCNIVTCMDGTWQGLEVFPAPCLDCESVCTFVVPAGCAKGPPDQATCVAGCQDTQAGACQLVFDQMLACAGEMPGFTCDAETRPVVAGCEAQFDALYQCTGL